MSPQKKAYFSIMPSATHVLYSCTTWFTEVEPETDRISTFAPMKLDQLSRTRPMKESHDDFIFIFKVFPFHFTFFFQIYILKPNCNV